MSNSVRPHRWQPTRLPCPWASLGKNTRVVCSFLIQCMKVKNKSEVAQSYPTLSDPMDCSLPGSSIHVIQARVLKWGAFTFSRHLLYSQTNPVKDLFISYFNDYKSILTGPLFFQSCSPTAWFLLIRQSDPTKTSYAQITDVP